MIIKKNYFRDLLIRRISLFLTFCAIILVSAYSGNTNSAVFLSWVVNFVPLLFLSIAAAIIISSGEIDISIGAVMSFLGMLLIIWISIFGLNLTNIIIAHIIVLFAGISIYLIIYLIISNKIPSLIVTLSVYFIAKGLSTSLQVFLQGAGTLWRSHGADFLVSKSGVLPSEYVLHVFGTPIISIIIVIGLISASYFWRFHTRSGLEHVAIGLNPVSARFVGISKRKVHFLTFLIAGVLITFATFLRLHGQTQGGWSANTGWGEELIAIAIAVIGGTRITGGHFDPISVVLSALIVYGLRDVVTNDLGLPSEMASIAFGLIMCIVVWFDMRRQRGYNQ